MIIEKRKCIALFIVSIVAVILAGCTIFPKTAQLNITADPNLVPYYSTDGKRYYTMNITESNGVGVTINELTFNYYNQDDEFISTSSFDSETFLEWFETDYVLGYSTIKNNLGHIHDTTESHYAIITVTGADDNGNSGEATTRIDYLAG